MTPFLIWSCPSRVPVLFAVLVRGPFLVPRVRILFLVLFCSNLAPFIVRSYSVFIFSVCVLVLFTVLICGPFLVFRVYILFLVLFCSNLALFIVYFYSVLILSVCVLV